MVCGRAREPRRQMNPITSDQSWHLYLITLVGSIPQIARGAPLFFFFFFLKITRNNCLQLSTCRMKKGENFVDYQKQLCSIVNVQNGKMEKFRRLPETIVFDCQRAEWKNGKISSITRNNCVRLSTCRMEKWKIFVDYQKQLCSIVFDRPLLAKFEPAAAEMLLLLASQWKSKLLVTSTDFIKGKQIYNFM